MSGQDSYLDQAKKMAGDAVNYASDTAKSAQDTIMGKVSCCLRLYSLPCLCRRRNRHVVVGIYFRVISTFARRLQPGPQHVVVCKPVCFSKSR